MPFADASVPSRLTANRSAAAANLAHAAPLLLPGFTPSSGTVPSEFCPGSAVKSAGPGSSSSYYPVSTTFAHSPSVVAHDAVGSSSWRSCVAPEPQSWFWVTDSGMCSGFTIPDRSPHEASLGHLHPSGPDPLKGTPVAPYVSHQDDPRSRQAQPW